MIFSRGKIRNKPQIKFDGDIMEVVDDYVYLGVTFNGIFNKAIKRLYDIANRAMFEILNKG